MIVSLLHRLQTYSCTTIRIDLFDEYQYYVNVAFTGTQVPVEPYSRTSPSISEHTGTAVLLSNLLYYQYDLLQ